MIKRLVILNLNFLKRNIYYKKKKDHPNILKIYEYF